MRGRFTPGNADEEWCERNLLARIHRYTLKRLRREIEPVEPRDFMRFLFAWQHVAGDTRLRGPDALHSVLGQLEGYECAAGSWEAELLPSRIADYSISWLDELCRSGRVVWTRIASTAHAAREGAAGPVRSTPIVVLSRRGMRAWTQYAGSADDTQASSRALAVLDHLREQGASFFDEIAHATRLLKVELEQALGELVARGLISADSFAGLRALLMPAAKRSSRHARRVQRSALIGIEDAGRWALTLGARPASLGNAPAAADARDDDQESLELLARALLRRYGVICWRLLAREADWLPPWRVLEPVYRRLEARGEIRGGRFVAGLSGEQFALPEAIPLLRKARAQTRSDTLVAVAATDPLNLVGIVSAGTRIASVVGTRILYCDGVAVAVLSAGKVQGLGGSHDEAVPAAWRHALLRRGGDPAPAASHASSPA